jgi:hypothetical protein
MAGIHAKRDKLPSIMYFEELICAMSATLHKPRQNLRYISAEIN